MVMAALRDHLPQSAWAGLLVRPETVLGWQRALVRRKWAAYRGRGRPPISAECRDLIIRMATENPGWGYFRIRGELLKVGHTVADCVPPSVEEPGAIRTYAKTGATSLIGVNCLFR